MVYNMHVRMNIILSSLAVVLLAGCTRPAAVVATHLNNREYYYNRYIEECVVVKGPPACDDFHKAVNRYKELVVEADAANQRGGKYPLQLKELKDQLKKVKRARGD